MSQEGRIKVRTVRTVILCTITYTDTDQKTAARLWSPNVLTFILSGILPDRTVQLPGKSFPFSVAFPLLKSTRTAASTALQRSHWPLIVQSDSIRNHSVRKDVLIVTWSISLMKFIIAAVVTPLGLYETLVSTDNVQTPLK